MRKFRASALELKEVSKSLEKEFLDKYHYQGFCGSRWCKGLFEGEELIILMSFGKPRYNKDFDWELIRLCTKEDCQVCGGASRLLKHFREENDGGIISYCNESLFSGKVYKSLGFEKLGSVKSYHYEKDGKSYHRSNFQRKKLEKMYPQYPRKDYTEKQVMELLGYTRVEETQGSYGINSSKKWYIYEIICNGYHYVGQHRYFHDNLNDGYTGSGAIIKKEVTCHPFEKKILCYGLLTQEAANTAEKAYIASNIQKYGHVNEGGYNVNLLSGGQGVVQYRTYRQSEGGWKLTDGQRANRSGPKSESTRAKMKLSNQLKAKDPEYLAKLKQAADIRKNKAREYFTKLGFTLYSDLDKPGDYVIIRMKFGNQMYRVTDGTKVDHHKNRSEAHKGHASPLKGIPRSEEVKRKISETVKKTTGDISWRLNHSEDVKRGIQKKNCK